MLSLCFPFLPSFSNFLFTSYSFLFFLFVMSLFHFLYIFSYLKVILSFCFFLISLFLVHSSLVVSSFLRTISSSSSSFYFKSFSSFLSRIFINSLSSQCQIKLSLFPCSVIFFFLPKHHYLKAASH